MTPEQKEKLKKIYELVKRGITDGERAAAEKALDKFLERYNLKGINLDSLDLDWYFLTYTTELEYSLIFRLSRTVLDVKPEYGHVSGKKRVGVHLTYLDWITLSSAYEYFRRHMKAQWEKIAAPHVARCRTTKTKNAKRKSLQDKFLSNYIIASNLYRPEELTTIDVSKLPKAQQQEYVKLGKVEGGQYNVQVTNGLYLESPKLN